MPPLAAPAGQQMQTICLSGLFEPAENFSLPQCRPQLSGQAAAHYHNADARSFSV